MHVKTFKGSDMQAALARVKAELGDEAIILGTKTVRGASGKGCEITAAIDPRSAAAPSRNTPLMPARDASGIMPQMDPSPADWACEWRQIKDQLMALVKPQLNMDELTPRQRVAIKYLEREEADMQVLLRVYLELKADPDRPILPVLESVAPCYGFESKKWRQKFHVFAGPHGVGKTLTLIRLALREKQARPKARICVVAADQGQGKGRLVLRHYADLSGLAFREAGSAEEMQELIKEAPKFDMIFVDMPGLTGKAALSEHLADLGLDDGVDMAAHLVLAPYFAASQYAEIARRYMCPQLQSLIWTKLDEACSFGALLNMARLTELPVSALSFGSGLKNSIAPAQSDMLWRLIFKHTLPGQSAEQAA
ncbi:flagellar biosynthesis protein FlhF [Humidesulfovibrio idahonensis]